MSKILLISSNSFITPYPVYPMGMAIIASALSEKGHTVHQFDVIAENNAEDRLRNKLKEYSPDYIGISIRNIDNLDSLSRDDPKCLCTEKNLVSLIRQCTDAPIIVGGSAVSTLPEEILDFIEADYGVVGEGEQIICDLIDTLSNGHPAPKILRSPDTLIKGEAMCSPLWERRLVEFYFEQSGMINLQTKRGCPFNCSYCIYPNLEGMHFRFRESRAVIDDLRRLLGIYNVQTVFFTDSVFNDPGDHYLELAEEIILSGLKIRWSGYFRPQGMGPKELKLLKRSGLYAMEVGTDAGCDETLNCLNKGFHFKDVIDFNRACIEAEIPSAHFFIFGGPGETENTLREGLGNIGMLGKSAIFIYSGIRILPRTDLYRRALLEGLLSEKAFLLNPVFYFSPDIDVESMNRTIEKEATGRPDFIFPPDKGTIIIDAMNAQGYRGLLWDRMISFSQNAGRRRRTTV
jgi:lipid biosynthesis B12-binding/radical SAM protein